MSCHLPSVICHHVKAAPKFRAAPRLFRSVPSLAPRIPTVGCIPCPLYTSSTQRAHTMLADGLVVSERASERTDRGQNSPTGLSWLERQACAIVRSSRTPQHVAFIMDGNRRFARDRGWEVQQGHLRGYDKLEETLRWCAELGVHGVTVFAFSIENFKRSSGEVGALMDLSEEKLRAMSDESHIVQRQGVRVRIVGDLSRVSASLYSEMQRVMRMTQGNTRHTLTVCFSYTARNEMATAVSRLSDACREGKLLPADISEQLLERCMGTSSPVEEPVDLIVRTSGEKRLSDFLLWQSATCAVVFTSVLWPELSLVRFLALLLRWQRAHAYVDHATSAPSQPPIDNGAAAQCTPAGRFAHAHAAPSAVGPTAHAAFTASVPHATTDGGAPSPSAEEVSHTKAAARTAAGVAMSSTLVGREARGADTSTCCSASVPTCAPQPWWDVRLASRLLALAATVAVGLAATAVAMRATGRAANAPLGGAALALCTWLLVALAFPTCPPAADCRQKERRQGHWTPKGATVGGEARWGRSGSSPSPRVRNFLAQLNVDRRR